MSAGPNLKLGEGSPTDTTYRRTSVSWARLGWAHRSEFDLSLPIFGWTSFSEFVTRLSRRGEPTAATPPQLTWEAPPRPDFYAWRNLRRQQGHSPSKPCTSAVNAVG